MYELTITTDFSAAHLLSEYPGKCRQLHGHNWQVEVTVAGSKLNELGMLMDFRVLKEEVSLVIGTLDHQFLNELTMFKSVNPTSENIAKYLYDSLAARPIFTSCIRVQSIKVWESPRSSVLYRG